ncbi:hypothetical protein B0H12DRAFT_1153486 [Mycena haematopus]|nr:hypothetical protein B0H12DRAFT_1153486 [Mycena haematopus]
MDLGSNFAAKLEPFMLMAKSLKGAAAAKLIADATSAPGVFELSKHETHSKSLALLELFAYRTYEDYMQNKDGFPPLNAPQTAKLKHLSIVSLASQRRVHPPIRRPSRVLDMPNVRELEDLIIDAIYLDILRGRLDQKQAQLEVEYTMGRDLAPGAVDAVLAALRDWASTTASVLSTLDAKLASVAAQTASRKERLAAHDAALQTVLLAASKDKTNTRGDGTGWHGGDAMDVDEPQGLVDRLLSRGEQENVKGKGRKPTAMESSKPQRKRNRF